MPIKLERALLAKQQNSPPPFYAMQMWAVVASYMGLLLDYVSSLGMLRACLFADSKNGVFCLLHLSECRWQGQRMLWQKSHDAGQ